MEIFVIVLLMTFILIVIGMYNSFVKKYQFVKNAEGSIEVYLKNRADLIPNLVEVCKGYCEHESKLLEKVINARSLYRSSNNLQERLDLDEMMSSQTKSVIMLQEKYPDLKADAIFLNLQSELTRCEDNIAATRRFMNSAVADYNTAIHSFPGNLIAKLFGYREFSYFKTDKSDANIKF